MVAGVLAALEESPSCTERGCLVKAREAAARPSTVQIGVPGTGARATETKPDAATRTRLKRAILPAAISDPAVIRLLAEAESREQPSRARTWPVARTERDDHRKQNSAYSPSSLVKYVWCL